MRKKRYFILLILLKIIKNLVRVSRLYLKQKKFNLMSNAKNNQCVAECVSCSSWHRNILCYSNCTCTIVRLDVSASVFCSSCSLCSSCHKCCIQTVAHLENYYCKIIKRVLEKKVKERLKRPVWRRMCRVKCASCVNCLPQNWQV